MDASSGSARVTRSSLAKKGITMGSTNDNGQDPCRATPVKKSLDDNDSTDDANMDTGEPLFFYGVKNPYGEFSQWYPSSFTISKARLSELVGYPVEGGEEDKDKEAAPDSDSSAAITFSCAEQCMMYCKAARFRDRRIQRLVLARAGQPQEQKRLGRQVVGTGFSDASWDAVKREVVLAASLAKFGQNHRLRRLLLGTGDKLLVEAAPRDRIWGIGFGAANAMKPANRARWGQNLLGQALMAARLKLRLEPDRWQR